MSFRRERSDTKRALRVAVDTARFHRSCLGKPNQHRVAHRVLQNDESRAPDGLLPSLATEAFIDASQTVGSSWGGGPGLIVPLPFCVGSLPGFNSWLVGWTIPYNKRSLGTSVWPFPSAIGVLSWLCHDFAIGFSGATDEWLAHFAHDCYCFSAAHTCVHGLKVATQQEWTRWR